MRVLVLTPMPQFGPHHTHIHRYVYCDCTSKTITQLVCQYQSNLSLNLLTAALAKLTSISSPIHANPTGSHSAPCTGTFHPTTRSTTLQTVLAGNDASWPGWWSMNRGGEPSLLALCFKKGSGVCVTALLIGGVVAVGLGERLLPCLEIRQLT
jgi:hypothetical protein